MPHSGLILRDVKLHFKITTFKEEYEFSLKTKQNKNRTVMLRYRQFGKAYVETVGRLKEKEEGNRYRTHGFILGRGYVCVTGPIWF